MNIKHILRADLNLIAAFQVLMEEKNVSRAAERLFISQPAMSRTLKRMRELFNDPLFTRTAHGLIPTPRAEALYQQVPAVLIQLEAILNPGDFSPESYSGVFRIASSDVMDHIYVRLVALLADIAPGVRLEHLSIDDNFYDDLKSGKLDFVIHALAHSEENLIRDDLGSAKINCLMRSEHPLAGKERLSLTEFLEYPHVRHVLPRITESGLGVVDEILARRSLARRIVYESPYLSHSIKCVLNTDCLLVIGINQDVTYLDDSNCWQAGLPEELNVYEWTYSLVHHERSSHNPAHQWLRQQILKCAKEK